jgi:uncharacterized membrane protein YkgB
MSMKNNEYKAFVFAHLALFVVFVWFGALKLFGLSPANELVTSLFNDTLGAMLPFLTIDGFIIFLGLVEVAIGVLFIIPKMERVAVILLIPHMITTIMPLVFLPDMTWQAPFVPSMEGQYIIKNIVIIALAAMVFVDLGKKRKAKAY